MDLNPTAFLATCELAAGPVRAGRCWWCQRPLPKGRRKWCCEEHGWEYYENHHWSWARSAALQRDDFRCVRCGSSEQPEVHHKNPVLGKHRQHGCWHHLAGLVVLCHECHLSETAAQRASGEIPRRSGSE